MLKCPFLNGNNFLNWNHSEYWKSWYYSVTFGGVFLDSMRKLSFHVSNNKIIIGRKSEGYRKYQVNSTAGDENISHSISVPV